MFISSPNDACQIHVIGETQIRRAPGSAVDRLEVADWAVGHEGQAAQMLKVGNVLAAEALRTGLLSEAP